MDVDIQGFIKKKRLVSKFYHASVGLFFMIGILLSSILSFDLIKNLKKWDGLIEQKADQTTDVKYNFDDLVDRIDIDRGNRLKQNTDAAASEYEYQTKNQILKVFFTELIAGWLFFLFYLLMPTALKNFYRFIMKE